MTAARLCRRLFRLQTLRVVSMFERKYAEKNRRWSQSRHPYARLSTEHN